MYRYHVSSILASFHQVAILNLTSHPHILSYIIRSHHIVKMMPYKALCCHSRGLFIFPRVLKSTMRGRALRYQVPLLWTSSQFGFWRHTQPKIKYQIPVVGSGDPEALLSYVAPASCCWNSHKAFNLHFNVSVSFVFSVSVLSFYLVTFP